MRILIVLIMIVLVYGIVYAHNQQYQGKAFTFQSPQRDHKIDVMLEGHNNEITVTFDNVTIGMRTNFCTPL